MTLPELPTRQYEWRHASRPRGSRIARGRGSRVTARRPIVRVRYVVVGIVDAVLLSALIHPELVRWVFLALRDVR